MRVEELGDIGGSSIAAKIQLFSTLELKKKQLIANLHLFGLGISPTANMDKNNCTIAIIIFQDRGYVEITALLRLSLRGGSY